MLVGRYQTPFFQFGFKIVKTGFEAYFGWYIILIYWKAYE